MRAKAAKELLARRRARSNLHDFITYINPDYIVSNFSRTVCAELDKFIVAMVSGERPILVLGAPPQHGKSDIVSRYLPAFFFGLYPDKRMAGLSYGKDLASDMNRDVQRIMMSEEYCNLFPDSALNSRRVVTIDVEAKRNSETFEIVGHKGSYIAQGVGGPLTGKKVDCGIIDDPIKNAKEALSATVKIGVWNWYISTFLTRLSKDSGQIIMATRWAVDDLSGRILSHYDRAVSLSFKAIDDEGKPLIPELHPLAKLQETKKILGEYFWSAMYQQSPIAQGGNIFKLEWFKWYRELPKMRTKRIYADTALKTSEKNDYSVMQCWGTGYDGHLYLIDQIRDRWEAPELLVQARNFYKKHDGRDGVRVSAFKVEDKASGTGLIQTLKREGVPIVAIQRNIDKATRYYDAAPTVEAGLIHLPEDAPYILDFTTEIVAVPTAPHDDQADPMADAISDIQNIKDYGAML